MKETGRVTSLHFGAAIKSRIEQESARWLPLLELVLRIIELFNAAKL